VWDEGANAAHEEEWFENKPVQETFWSRLFQSWNNRRTWRKLKGRLPARARLLEIGVGSGSLLRFLRDRGLEMEGCDLARSICERIQNVDGIPMHNCPVAEIHSSTSYDFVVMNHVLEHVEDPIQFLKDVRNRLKDGGGAHIGVPNVACWEALLPGWNSYEPYHLVYFTPATLQRAVEQAGFEVSRIGTHDSFSGWFLALLRTLLRTNKKTAGERLAEREAAHLSWMGHAYRFAMVLSGVIVLPIRLFQQAIGRGDEVVLIARKAENKAT
jgi:2-polyprenyl-3-methyl-5-hydroxy-6-metoxy-1,4-benzoquinol methylase